MNAQRWLEASRRYNQLNVARVTSESAVSSLVAEQKAKQVKLLVRTNAILQSLSRFITSDDCYAARELLGASNRHIVIAEENEWGGSGTVYFLDCRGLMRSVEAMGTWVTYVQKGIVPEPQITPAEMSDVVNLLVRQGATADQVMEKIHRELERIADEVLVPSAQ